RARRGCCIRCPRSLLDRAACFAACRAVSPGPGRALRTAGLDRGPRMSGPRVSIVNYTLSMMRGGGETRDLAFATHLRDLGCEVTLVSVDPLFGRVRHPIQGVPSRLL